jgi:hypothetical protein
MKSQQLANFSLGRRACSPGFWVPYREAKGKRRANHQAKHRADLVPRIIQIGGAPRVVHSANGGACWNGVAHSANGGACWNGSGLTNVQNQEIEMAVYKLTKTKKKWHLL